jgi:DNA-binding transcriptional MerR regulator
MAGRGPTLSATEFARLTGVSRERLRTWERRHGFPEPVRAAGGARRYALADVSRSIAVRRAVDTGVPLPQAIAGAQAEPPAEAQPAMLAAGLDAAPQAVLLLSGPQPARIVYANRAARRQQRMPQVGALLDEHAAERLAPAFAARSGAELEHPPWDEQGTGPPALAVPLEGQDGGALLALYDCETPEANAERLDAERLATDLERARGQLEDAGDALALCTEVGVILRERGGVDAIVASTDLLLRRLGAADAALAPYMGGQIVIGRSARGSLGPEMITVAAHPQLAAALRDGGIAQLPPASLSALGLEPGSHALAVPALCAGEPLGVLLLLFAQESSLTAALRNALELLGPALGLALMHERLLVDEPGAGR